MSHTDFLKNKRVLITGAGGFIGAALAAEVAKGEPKQLICAGRSPVQAQEAVKDAQYVTVDLRSVEQVQDWARTIGKPFDVVFHAAGKIDQSVRSGIYREQFALHADSTIHLMDALLQTGGWGRFVHVGSNAEYGDAPCPQSAETREEPNSAYGCSKLAATKLVIARGKSEKLDTIVARPFLVYGAGQNPKSFLGAALSAAKEGATFPTTPGEQTRDFVSVEKVVADLIAAADPANLPSGEVVNVCTGVERTIKSVLEQLQNVFVGFIPQFSSVEYRPTELMRSSGVAFCPVTTDVAVSDMQRYFESCRDYNG